MLDSFKVCFLIAIHTSLRIVANPMTRLITLTLSIAALLSTIANVSAHEGPDPISHWVFNSEFVSGRKITARLGPDGEFDFTPKVIDDVHGESVFFSTQSAVCRLGSGIKSVKEFLPTKALTISAWVTVDEPKRWGGIIGAIQDNGETESGWVLGYDEKTFTFAISTKGADDGDGKMTYITAKTPYVAGKFFHVSAVYDGKTTQLFVNGNLEAETKEQSGEILYPSSGVYTIGAYEDANEFHPHRGRIRDVMVYDIAAKPEWVKESYEHNKRLAELDAEVPPVPLEFVVMPYLQYATQHSMTVMWQTTTPSSTIVRYGENNDCLQSKSIEGNHVIHEVPLTGLKPETQYFYRIETKSPAGQMMESETRTFQTAVKDDSPFAFAVISDTQGNPVVSGTLAQMAWEQRPHFLLHPGDLVSTGSDNQHWIKHFFSSMEPLISRVAMFPVLGNHEQDAANYYNYMSLPKPEYYYKFTYGNAEFFMIDTNRKVGPESEQYKWLEQQLKASTAKWKFVCHHHPPYSSDENDYGDLWKTNRGTRGDLRARQLVPLYESYGVDIVWNGHIHSYERTWRVRKGKAVQNNAPFYMITGGGGGGLETPGPFRPFFQNNVRRGHHYVMVYVNDGLLELKSFALDGRLFDTIAIDKSTTE
jgi:predicted phosphodiesterase